MVSIGQRGMRLSPRPVFLPCAFSSENRRESILPAFASLVERLKKWPTQNDLLLERGRDSSFPSLKVVQRLTKTPSFTSKLLAYCSDDEKLSTAARIATERIEAQEAEPSLLGRASINDYVYILRSGRRYKIGHTTSPSHRHREVRLDLPDPIILVHAIPTDDPIGIESYWHLRFSSKRVRDTEFYT